VNIIVICLEMLFEIRLGEDWVLHFWGAAMKIFLRYFPVWVWAAVALWVYFFVNKPQVYFWCVLFAGMAFASAMPLRRVKRPGLLYTCICLASVFAALSIGELYLGLSAIKSEYVPLAKRDRVPALGIADCDSNIRKDPLLGYSPKPEKARTSCLRSIGDVPVYDIIVTTLDSGWRITPQRGDKARTAVIFLGCSYTFGDGLRDEQSYPYLVGEALGDAYQTFNFGLSGYGTHQMLALIESGRLDDIFKRYEKVYVFYLTLDDHIRRCGGYASWDTDGPRYILQNGVATYTGSFAANRSWLRRSLDKIFKHSNLYAALTGLPFETHRKELTDLYFAMLDKANKILEQKYHSNLVVISWVGNKSYAKEYSALGLQVVDPNPYFPDFATNKDAYGIKNDGHPNARAATLLAQAVVDYLRRQPR